SDDPEAEDVGHKWTLSALLRHLRAQGTDTSLLMQRIEEVVVKAVLATAPPIISACRMFVPYPRNCFGCSQHKSIHAIIIFETFAALSKMSDLEDFDHVFDVVVYGIICGTQANCTRT
ncbi:hypothetical protein L9F63_026506, partial [Diploptera punctata]